MARVRAPRFHMSVSLDGRLFTMINLSLAVGAVLRAWDYMVLWAAPMPNPDALATIEAAAPLPVWAGMLVVGALLVVVGLFTPPRLLMVMVGHAILCVTYTALGVGLVYQAVADDIPGGWRVGTGLLFVFTVIHGVFAMAVNIARQVEQVRSDILRGAARAARIA